LAPRCDYHVWYRVAQADRDTETAVRGMMARLACRSGVAGVLKKKQDEPRLWMEVYAGVADTARFERLLAQALDEGDVEMFLDGCRRTECFIADDPVPAACAAHPEATSS
jgi:hypothetical protein